MLTTRKLAGFTKGQADTIRKGMAKKQNELLNEYKPYFIYGSGNDIDTHTGKPFGIKGCINNGIDEKKAKKIWQVMEDFGSYAFNKSHGAGYADVSAKTGWVSLYHPTIFMKSNLNSYIINSDKVKLYLAYCYRNNIKILPPDVNESKEYFSVCGKEEGIRFGLKGIRQVKKVSELIQEERKKRGNFVDYQDFVERMMTYQKIDSRNIEGLVYTGALDCFEGTRKAKIFMLKIDDKNKELAKYNILKFSKNAAKDNLNGQITMFDLAEDKGLSDIIDMKKVITPNIEEFDKEFLLEKENEYAGFYISGHPLDDYEVLLKERKIIDIVSLTEGTTDEEIKQEEDSIDFGSEQNEYINTIVSVAGIIKELKIHYDKNRNIFYTFRLEDRTGSIGAVCFSSSTEKNQDKLIEGKKVIVTGKFTVNDFGPQININDIIDLAKEIQKTKILKVISNTNRDIAANQWRKLRSLANNNVGEVKIKFKKGEDVFDFPINIKMNKTLLNSIKGIFGENNVIYI